jgi:multidrug efflux pump subunit AcrA (membrane-fusion protein)
MQTILKRSIPVLMAAILLISAGCTAAAKGPVTTTRIVPVQRGNIDVTVSVDGKLNMPQAFDLHFGAPGNVLNVNVKEGDIVKAGTVLATLDATAQELAIKTANNKVQTDLASLYETVPRLPKFRTSYYLFIDNGGNLTTGLDPVTHLLDLANLQFNDNPDPSDQFHKYITIGPHKYILTAPEGIHNDISYPTYYPTGTILDGYAWYQQDLVNASQLLVSDNYTAASAELNVAVADLDSIIIMIEDTINNPDSGLGNTAPVVNDQNILYMEATGQDPSGAAFYIWNLRKYVDQIKQGQADIQKTRDLLAQKKYDEADAQYQVVLAGMNPIGLIVYTNYNILRLHDDTNVYGKDLSMRFFNAAEVKLNAAAAGLEKGGLASPDLETNMRIAEHFMMLSNAVLGTNDYVLQHGLSLKNQQQFNVNLANDLVTLKDRNNDFLKSVILAPFDGIVVAVNLKTNDVLSQIDYASKGDIMMVDTSQLQFKGQVDEIDITKVKSGQNVTISVDAVPNKTFTGKVSFISPYGTPDANGVVRFNVTILLDPTDVPLKGLLTSTAEIAVTSVQNVLQLPLAAITTSPAGSFVTVVASDNVTTEKRQVTLGLQNQQSAAVITGLKEGDRVQVQESSAGAPTTTRPPGAPAGGGGGGGGGAPSGGGRGG